MLTLCPRLRRCPQIRPLCPHGVGPDGRDARDGLRERFQFYNNLRPHQVMGYQTRAEVFASRPMEATKERMRESLTLDTLRTTWPNLNNTPVLP